jgi:hypothetical protein
MFTIKAKLVFPLMLLIFMVFKYAKFLQCLMIYILILNIFKMRSKTVFCIRNKNMRNKNIVYERPKSLEGNKSQQKSLKWPSTEKSSLFKAIK